MLRYLEALLLVHLLAGCAAPESSAPKIIGGEVLDNEFLYRLTAVVTTPQPNGGVTRCTGAFVSTIHVLTAASCVPGLTTVVSVYSGETMTVSGVTVHPGAGADLALLRLSQPIPHAYRAAPLAEVYQNGETGFAVGAGEHDGQPNPAGILKLATAATKEVDPSGTDFRLDALVTNAGDGGGPLFVASPSGFQLLGVLRGSRAGKSDYESVPYFRQWIINAMGFPPNE